MSIRPCFAVGPDAISFGWVLWRRGTRHWPQYAWLPVHWEAGPSMHVESERAASINL